MIGIILHGAETTGEESVSLEKVTIKMQLIIFLFRIPAFDIDRF